MSQHLGNVHVTYDKHGRVSLMHAVARFLDVTTGSFDQQWLYEDASNQVFSKNSNMDTSPLYADVLACKSSSTG